MGSLDRSKKRVHLWKKAVVHLLVCFVMGLLTGFGPSKPGILLKSEVGPASNNVGNYATNRSLKGEGGESKLTPRRQVIVITPTNDRDPLRGVLLRRMANTLKLVPPPLLWIVVDSHLESSNVSVSHILSRTGVMYRHLLFNYNNNNFPHHSTNSELDDQINLALKHIEHHRLSGILHFAALSNVYDLSFFHHIRAIQGFGAWPIAKLSGNRNRKRGIIKIQGPVCQSSQVIGWHVKGSKLEKQELTNVKPSIPIPISSFGFNSSILWDPERWGRLSSTQGAKQNSLKFVKQAIIEDDTKLQGVPFQDCSKVNMWQLHISRKSRN